MTSWLTPLFGADNAPMAATVTWVILVIVALFALMAGYRAFRNSRMGRGLHGEIRLDVIDAAPIDGRRRLVLVRRDDVEHLIVIGGHNDFVVESGITRQAAGATLATPQVKSASHAQTTQNATLRAKPAPTPTPTPTASPAPAPSLAADRMRAVEPMPAPPPAPQTPSPAAAPLSPALASAPQPAQAPIVRPQAAQMPKPAQPEPAPKPSVSKIAEEPVLDIDDAMESLIRDLKQN